MAEAATQPWERLIADAVSFRHDLHRHPELGWQERQTAERIRTRLTDLAIDWRPCADTGTLARLAPRAGGRHVALRADIDALPIVEASDVAWRSTTDGCMHACGHDGHSATLMAVAAWLKSAEDRLPGPVSLFFQPAEEGGHGAKKMIEDGALDGVDVIFGWHNWPAIRYGRAVCPDGVVMAGNGTFRIEVTGRGGHSSQPDVCRDPVLAGSAIVLALQQLVSRRLPPQQATVVSVTSFDAASGVTVIPDRATLAGSYRLADTDRADELAALLSEVAMTTAQAYGVTADVQVSPRYQATINDATAAGEYRQLLQQELGCDALDPGIAIPVMASEDFSYYLRERPGAFALIGAGRGDGDDEPCHSPRYDFNDNLIAPVARIYLRLAGASLNGTKQ